MRPNTKFEIITQVIMTEYYEQRDDPPGRDPYGERKTILVTNSKELKPHMVPETIRNVVEIA